MCLSAFLNSSIENIRCCFFVLGLLMLVDSDNESNVVPLYVTGGESALDIFHTIFYEQKAEVLSQGHGWTEGPVVVPVINRDYFNEILFFSDTIQDKIWMYEESEFEPHHQFTVAVEESGSCKSARSDCELVAEPGSNGLAFDAVNKNLLICQHGGRSLLKLPIDPSNGMPLASDIEVCCIFLKYFVAIKQITKN